MLVVNLAAVMVFANGIEALCGRQRPYLGVGVNRDPARMDPASGGFVEHDRVVSVRDLEAVAVAVAVAAAAVAGAE